MSAARERQSFAAEFQEERMEVFALTGEGWFDGKKRPWEKLCRVSMPATAWKRAGTEEIHRGDFLLQAVVDERTAGVLRERCPAESLIQTRARLSPDGRRLLVLDMPEPAQEPDLLRLLAEQTGRALYPHPELGLFLQTAVWAESYDRRLSWLGRTIPVSLLGSGAELARASETLGALFSDQERWNARIGLLAAREYLDYARQFCEETEQELPPGGLLEMEPLPVYTLQVGPGDAFVFWLDGGTLLGGHDVRVEGSLSGGPGNIGLDG